VRFISLNYDYDAGVISTEDKGSFLRRVVDTVSQKPVPEKMGGPAKLYIVMMKLSLDKLSALFTE
jgi:hypothetical protein